MAYFKQFSKSLSSYNFFLLGGGGGWGGEEVVGGFKIRCRVLFTSLRQVCFVYLKRPLFITDKSAVKCISVQSKGHNDIFRGLQTKSFHMTR